MRFGWADPQGVRTREKLPGGEIAEQPADTSHRRLLRRSDGTPVRLSFMHYSRMRIRLTSTTSNFPR